MRLSFMVCHDDAVLTVWWRRDDGAIAAPDPTVRDARGAGLLPVVGRRMRRGRGVVVDVVVAGGGGGAGVGAARPAEGQPAASRRGKASAGLLHPGRQSGRRRRRPIIEAATAAGCNDDDGDAPRRQAVDRRAAARGGGAGQWPRGGGHAEGDGEGRTLEMLPRGGGRAGPAGWRRNASVAGGRASERISRTIAIKTMIKNFFLLFSFFDSLMEIV